MTEFPDVQILELGDGRQLGFAVYGNPNGPPVYYSHGFYGSRLEAQLAANAATECGIQLIAIDRPGIGRSTAQSARTLASWASDLATLADHLGHEQFRILGVSGGGPYALAAARELPARVTRIALCCSLAPLTNRSALPANYRIALWADRHFQQLLRLINYLLYAGARTSPEMLLRIIRLRLSAADKKILASNSTRSVLCASLSEAIRQGPLYGEEELTIFGADWSALLMDLGLPIDIWHGDKDEVVPVALAHQLKGKLPQASLHIVPGEGHFSLPILHAATILRALLEN